MSMAGFDLAEAYVLQDRHRKKMKMEMEKAKSGTAESKIVKSSCLFWELKEVYASNAKKTCSAENAEVGS
ncbi:hypothetical protein RchiOBHm_Chr7g0240201 [Rosa chinensis]|uniref:Uncharacterized protein n=1 Tax=Rosa chinensis TaxID=74649 RepID=A0A2P6PHW8_ROSCH|nr:hypothetical protein RchiOBHm_Chr7g0240201 [Rosa chinensis]